MVRIRTRLPKPAPGARIYTKETEVDVLFGRGLPIANHNEQYLLECQSRKPAYWAAQPIGKQELRDGMLQWVAYRGGRFLEKDYIGWYIAHPTAAREKVTTAIRGRAPLRGEDQVQPAARVEGVGHNIRENRMTRVDDITPVDVLFGRENHNEDFHAYYQSLRPAFLAPDTTPEQIQALIDEAWQRVAARGGRFLKVDGNGWYIARPTAARDTIIQTIRGNAPPGVSDHIEILPSEQITYAVPSDRDFLFEDASIVKTHLEEKSEQYHQRAQQAGQTRQDNLVLIDEVLKWISDGGGRFLKLHGNRWYIITLTAAREDVTQNIFRGQTLIEVNPPDQVDEDIVNWFGN